MEKLKSGLSIAKMIFEFGEEIIEIIASQGDSAADTKIGDLDAWKIWQRERIGLNEKGASSAFDEIKNS